MRYLYRSLVAGLAFASCSLAAVPPIQVIGLTGGAYQGRNDEPQRVNAVGQVTGFANRLFSTGTTSYLGADLWYYDPTGGTTRIIGLMDSAHTNGYGANENTATFLSNSGQGVGYTARYAPTSGSDVWLYDPTSNTTLGIGLTDAAHTYNGGTNNLPTAMNANGQVTGYAARYANGGGYDAWRYDFSTNTTQIIGLYNAVLVNEHAGKYRHSHPIEPAEMPIKPSGQHAGSSR